MKGVFTETFKSKTRDDWVEIFEGGDACVAGIVDFQEAVDHPHNKARSTYINVNGQTQPAPAPRFSRTQCDIPAAPSSEGADTRQVLAEWGFDEGAVDALEKSGALS